MQIYWGIRPFKSIEAQSMEDICDNALEIVRAKAGLESGDILVLTAGIPAAHAICRDQRYGASNMMRIVTVE
jgi:pyruvate kinase